MIQQVWGKLNANERMASIGALLSVVAFLVGAVTYAGYAFGISGLVGLIAPIGLLVVYYLKYTNSSIKWPAPVPVIAFAIGAIEGIGAAFGLLGILGILGLFGFGFVWLLGPIINIVAGAMMAWFTYKEWQASKGVAAAPPAAPLAPPAAPPAAPVAPPAAPVAPPAAPPADEAQ